MKRREFTKDKRTFIIEEYKSFGELINTSKSRKRNFGEGHFKCDGSYADKKWVGVDTYEEAENLLKYGWQDISKINMLNERVRQMNKVHDVQKIGFKNDIVGFAPVVPNAIIGIPQNMINSVRVPKKQKVITILADMTFSSNTSTDEVLNWGAELISDIIRLEKSGFRVRLEYVNVFSQESGKVHACRVLMKSENQPFDVKRYMFPLAHKAMFRSLMFDWYEKLPNATQLGGYGMSLIHHNSKSRDFIKKEICEVDNCYYITCKESISKVLKGVA